MARSEMAGEVADDTATPGESSTAANMRSLRQFAWAGLLLLVVQSISGVFLNLYVTLPIPAGIGAVFVLAPVLTVHIASAFLLLAGGVFLLLYGWRTGTGRLRALSVGAFISVVVAVQEGFAFTFTQNNAFSFGMEMGFLGAMVLCGTLLFLTNEPPGLVASLTGSQPTALQP